MSRDISFLPFNVSGTSPLMILCASPSAIAVLPTPGSPANSKKKVCQVFDLSPKSYNQRDILLVEVESDTRFLTE